MYIDVQNIWRLLRIYLHTLRSANALQTQLPISNSSCLLDEPTSQWKARNYIHVHNLFVWCNHNIPELLIFTYSATPHLWASFPFLHDIYKHFHWLLAKILKTTLPSSIPISTWKQLGLHTYLANILYRFIVSWTLFDYCAFSICLLYTSPSPRD